MKRKNPEDLEEATDSKEVEDKDEDEDDEEDTSDKEEEIIDIASTCRTWADAIIQQPHIGSIVKVDDSTDPYAVMTILSFETHQETLKPLLEYLREKTKGDQKKSEELQKIFKESHVGFLINERLVNMPAEVVAPMFKMLSEELEWSVEERQAKRFDYLVLISKTFAEAAESEETSEELSNPKKKKKAGKKNKQFFNVHAEDEVFNEFSELAFDFALHKKSDDNDDSGLSHARRVYILNCKRLNDIKKRLEGFFAP
ncbi:p21-C-terminal region-binding protein-domain-containing protein [Chytridium lagenaria]|nr:p21-C-terminal region-binding protein-domain-containing protein [Chytridium lagenaria]